MNARLNNDLKDTESLLNAALQVGLKYLAELDQVPTSVKVSEDANMAELPAEGKGGLAILQEFKERFSEMMVASAGPGPHESEAEGRPNVASADQNNCMIEMRCWPSGPEPIPN